MKKFWLAVTILLLNLVLWSTGWFISTSLQSHETVSLTESADSLTPSVEAGKNPHGSKSLSDLTTEQRQELNRQKAELDLALIRYLQKQEQLGLINKAVAEKLQEKVKELLDTQSWSKISPSYIPDTDYSL